MLAWTRGPCIPQPECRSTGMCGPVALATAGNPA
eukprot:CAMPEP_0202858214 /NCGR_PEP_ID=MMETSP1391-20130828/843_1 /ASSEMBLY_ACC=CAM_ASM_000867 /TAXON_ID=1034604 /ORGANISM="Chlamydomonas leiostraca, Strain SAG 11-49" /LENGTH=33 /DNA_ID= /DNA_START= /DNA_END= /DNA_ORIENTATION=